MSAESFLRLRIALAIERADKQRIPEGYGIDMDDPEVSDWGVFLADAVLRELSVIKERTT